MLAVTIITPDGPVEVSKLVFIVPLAYIAVAWLLMFWFGLRNTFYDDRGMEWWAAVFWPLTVLMFIAFSLADGCKWLRDRYVRLRDWNPRLFSRLACIGFWLTSPLRPGEAGRRIRIKLMIRKGIYDPWDERVKR